MDRRPMPRAQARRVLARVAAAALAALAALGCAALERPDSAAGAAPACDCADVEALAQRLKELGSAIEFYRHALDDLELAGSAPQYTPERGFTMSSALRDLTHVSARRSGVDPLPGGQVCLASLRDAARAGGGIAPSPDWTMRDYALGELAAHRAERSAMRREIAQLDARCATPPAAEQRPALNPVTFVLKALLVAYSLWVIFL